MVLFIKWWVFCFLSSCVGFLSSCAGLQSHLLTRRVIRRTARARAYANDAVVQTDLNRNFSFWIQKKVPEVYRFLYPQKCLSTYKTALLKSACQEADNCSQLHAANNVRNLPKSAIQKPSCGWKGIQEQASLDATTANRKATLKSKDIFSCFVVV